MYFGKEMSPSILSQRMSSAMCPHMRTSVKFGLGDIQQFTYIDAVSQSQKQETTKETDNVPESTVREKQTDETFPTNSNCSISRQSLSLTPGELSITCEDSFVVTLPRTTGEVVQDWRLSFSFAFLASSSFVERA